MCQGLRHFGSHLIGEHSCAPPYPDSLAVSQYDSSLARGIYYICPECGQHFVRPSSDSRASLDRAVLASRNLDAIVC
jgi:hypothetical protein